MAIWENGRMCIGIRQISQLRVAVWAMHDIGLLSGQPRCLYSIFYVIIGGSRGSINLASLVSFLYCDVRICTVRSV